jgi:hypothetical protein
VTPTKKSTKVTVEDVPEDEDDEVSNILWLQSILSQSIKQFSQFFVKKG